MNLEELRARKGFICDMDGVIYLGNQLLPGVAEFVNWLNENDKRFLFLTNSSERSPKELRQKLQRMGLDIGEEHFYTSALATAAFLKKQAPGCTAFVIGAPGLLNALYDVGVTMNDVDPDYVIVGETASYNYEVITKAVRLVLNGARLIATNSDLTGPTEFGIAPACRSLVAPIELATGKKAYFMGKPNPLMMRTGLQLLGVHSEEAAMVGDRMDTDVIAGMESGLATVLVLSGCTSVEQVRDNLRIFDAVEPGAMSESELDLMDRVREAYRSRTKVGCTGCAYCMPCPQGVDIPGAFSAWNNASLYGGLEKGNADYKKLVEAGKSPKNCVECGACMAACPQHIEIIEELKKAVEMFEG